MNLKRMALKIACLSVLMMGSGLWAMDVECKKDIKQSNQELLNAHLMQAASHGNRLQVAQLIDKGANVNERNEAGRTALMEAVLTDCYEICELLIARGADVNEHDKFGNTALMLAAMIESNEVVKLLIDKGANVNAQTSSGQTALTLAAHLDFRGNNKNICEQIIKAIVGPSLKEQQASATALYGFLQKKKNIGGKDIARVIGQELRAQQMQKYRQNKAQAEKQIMKIDKDALRSELQGYLNSL
jgi:hypothetical protein